MSVSSFKIFRITCVSKWGVLLFAIVGLLLISCTRFGASVQSPPYRQAGVLVMAHGGSPEWNAAVEEAVQPMQTVCPIEIAFGMADRSSLQAAILRLEEKGVSRIAVVRLFLSIKSFHHRTEYLLGIRPDPPATFVQYQPDMGGTSPSDLGAHGDGNQRVPPPVTRKAVIVLNQQGLLDSPSMGEIIAARVRALGTSPSNESVLILAHGAGDDSENDSWILKMDKLADKVREAGPYREVRVETLREDWPDKRSIAEERIRTFVEQGNREGGRVIVVPFRVFGFGPYVDVLQGLTYVSDGRGLLPHPLVMEWIKAQATESFSRAGMTSPFVSIQ